jgi:DMSO/TMAO reductase YedYZ heme-binding membrane subunit
MVVLGQPLFIWFGILGFIMVVLAAGSGMMRAKLVTHRMLALLAMIFLVLHVLGVLGVY